MTDEELIRLNVDSWGRGDTVAERWIERTGAFIRIVQPGPDRFNMIRGFMLGGRVEVSVDLYDGDASELASKLLEILA